MGWLNRERIILYPKVVIAIYLLIYGYWILSGNGLIDRQGKPIGSDFVGFWAASQMVNAGDASGVYDKEKLFSVEKDITGIFFPLPINYPPSFLLLIAPLSLLPYLCSLIIWVGSTFLFYLFVLYRIAPHAAALWLAAAFPGTFQNGIHGQNGFISAALLGGGLLCLDRFPFTAGALLGILSYKPHLAVIIPVALIAGRNWRALAGMVVSAGSLIVISIVFLGWEPWVSFLKNVSYAFRLLENASLPLYQMPTVFAAALLIGINPLIAKLIHGINILAVLSIIAWLWLKQSDLFLRASALILGILLVTPHANTHDLAILALPIAWMGWTGHKEGWLSGEKQFLSVCWITPLICGGIAFKTKIQIAPLILFTFLLLVLRRHFKNKVVAESESEP